MRFCDTWFQSSEVRGAVWSGVFEFESNANGVSFVGGAGSLLLLFMLLLMEDDASEGSDHNLRWSPEVASRSVDCFWEFGECGSHSKRVTGYE